jgi:hypothetical protein
MSNLSHQYATQFASFILGKNPPMGGNIEQFWAAAKEKAEQLGLGNGEHAHIHIHHHFDTPIIITNTST